MKVKHFLNHIYRNPYHGIQSFLSLNVYQTFYKKLIHQAQNKCAMLSDYQVSSTLLIYINSSKQHLQSWLPLLQWSQEPSVALNTKFAGINAGLVSILGSSFSPESCGVKKKKMSSQKQKVTDKCTLAG